MAAPRLHPAKTRTAVLPTFADVPLRAIRVPDNRLRTFDPDWAVVLAEMFRDSGQQTPIDLVPEGKGFVLISGLHRLEAAKLLKWPEITAQIVPEACLPSIDVLRRRELLENLARKDLNALERSGGLAELKDVHERLYPETRHGGKRGNQHTGGEKRQVAIFAFCHHAAETTGLSDRAVRLAITIWNGLSDDSRMRLKGTSVAEKQSELQALSELAAETQSKVLDQILAPVPKAASVADALVLLAGRPPLTNAEQQFKRVSNSLSKLNMSGRAAVFRQHKAEILDLARREGWFDA
ncbi:ParB N-terminal domain-containing protein [Labrenzia sp. R4_2]|uniref:ParB N-terminal domain-containing protein n=1 Tax=Labrenzia sp. R4_2 TaxID=2821107 RepID=UPI001ADB09EF|nr:ParB N-terminal domain-containing protein [Labrenzia sp. R4_2]MBO9419182.1 ParB N-terminal domain-containing protein [Labrenzia sp. R4_2]